MVLDYHHGNQVFLSIASEYQTVYLCARRSDKPQVAWDVLNAIRSRGGRFVRRVKTVSGKRGRRSGFVWEEIEEKAAYEKVCQALREGAPELRRQMMASTKLKQKLHNVGNPCR